MAGHKESKVLSMARLRRFLLFLFAVALPVTILVASELFHLRLERDGMAMESSVVQGLTSFSLRSEEDYTAPPLDQMLDENGNIIGDVQKMLYFAIIGFGKCGTSTIMHWLADHPELQSLTSEVYALVNSEPDRLIRRLHKNLPAPLKRGYKCPGDIKEQHTLDYYRTLWPKTKLFVGVRHPVDWFRSLYNFRVQNFRDFRDMLHPNQLIGGCYKASKMTCTSKGDFGYHLMRMGKQHWNGTRPTTFLERNILHSEHRQKPFDPEQVPYMPNPVFLFDVEQLGDENATRKAQMRTDIQHYLDLKQPLPEVLHFVPGRTWEEQEQAEKDAKKIDICQDDYIPLRKELMTISRLSSKWIREVFLKLPGIYYSNGAHLNEILLSWMKDPCGDKVDSLTEEEIDAIYERTMKVWLDPDAIAARKDAEHAAEAAALAAQGDKSVQR